MEETCLCTNAVIWHVKWKWLCVVILQLSLFRIIKKNINEEFQKTCCAAHSVLIKS